MRRSTSRCIAAATLPWLLACSSAGGSPDASRDASLPDGTRPGDATVDADSAPGVEQDAAADAPDATPVVAPDLSLSGPVVLTAEGMLERTWERIRSARQPFARAWRNVLRRADGSLSQSYETYRGTDHVGYYRAGRGQGLVARANALAYRLTEERAYLDKAREILLLWARDGDAYPFSLPEGSHSAGLVLGRVGVVFADVYALLHGALEPAERETIESWLASYVPVIRESQRIWVEGSIPGFSPPYLGRQYFNNHLGAQTMGMLAIGYATGDDALVAHALSGEDNPRDLETLIDGVIVMSRADLYESDPTLTEGRPDPAAGEIFDRYRTLGGSGLHYSHLHLRLLTLMALMAHNNGAPRDYFAFVGPDGEQLVLGHELYARFLVSGRTDERTGYYADEDGVDWGLLPLLEVANRFYPEQPEIVRALSSRDRVAHDGETFGWTAPLVHGSDDVPDMRGRWTFERDGDLEGWRVRRSLTAQVRDGSLVLEVTGADPGILSPRSLGFDTDAYGTLTLRMRNESAHELCQVFFATESAPGFSAERVVGTALTPHDDALRDYTVELSGHPDWEGTLEQLRIDVVDGGSGRVVVDSWQLR